MAVTEGDQISAALGMSTTTGDSSRVVTGRAELAAAGTLLDRRTNAVLTDHASSFIFSRRRCASPRHLAEAVRGL